jgi:hypothetical protein
MKNVVFWDVSPRGSCMNRHFRGTYRLHLQGKNNQWTKNMLAIASECSTLWRINHYMRKEAIEWHTLFMADAKECFWNGVSVAVFFRYPRYIMRGRCFWMDVIKRYLYGRLPWWQTTIWRGLGGGGNLSDQITKGEEIIIGTAQLSGPCVMPWEF